MKTDFKIGALLENSIGQFTKIINVRNGVYGLGGWATRANAEKQTVAHIHLNGYGLRINGIKVVSGKGGKAAPAEPTKAAPKARAPRKTSAKKAPAKKKATARKSK